MTSPQEKPQPLEIKSGKDFLQALEIVWGGPLYIALSAEMEHLFSDIRSKKVDAMNAAMQLLESRQPAIAALHTSSNVANDFQENFFRQSIHPEAAHTHVHLLACGFCRGLLLNNIDQFLVFCLDEQTREEAHLITQDQLPFKISEGKWLLEVPTNFPDFDQYFAFFRGQANRFADILKLSGPDAEQFYVDFVGSVDHLREVLDRFMRGSTTGLSGIEFMEAFITQETYFRRIAEPTLEPTDTENIPDLPVTPNALEMESYNQLFSVLLLQETHTLSEALELLKRKLRVLIQEYGYQRHEEYLLFEQAVDFAQAGNTFLAFIACLKEAVSAQQSGELPEMSLHLALAEVIRVNGFFSNDDEYIVIDDTLEKYAAMREMIRTLGGGESHLVKPLLSAALYLDEKKAKGDLAPGNATVDELTQAYELQVQNFDVHMWELARESLSNIDLQSDLLNSLTLLEEMLSQIPDQPEVEEEDDDDKLVKKFTAYINSIQPDWMQELVDVDEDAERIEAFNVSPTTLTEVEDVITIFQKRCIEVGLTEEGIQRLATILKQTKKHIQQNTVSWPAFRNFVKIFRLLKGKYQDRPTFMEKKEAVEERMTWREHCAASFVVLADQQPFFTDQNNPQTLEEKYQKARLFITASMKKQRNKGQGIALLSLDYNKAKFVDHALGEELMKRLNSIFDLFTGEWKH